MLLESIWGVVSSPLVYTPLIYGLVSFYTNKLAVKMLFRPHTEKRVGRVKIPFTPGLIPKGKGELAAKLGAALGENLLTPEALVQAATKPEIMENISNMVVGFLVDISKSPRPISQIFAENCGIDANKAGWAFDKVADVAKKYAKKHMGNLDALCKKILDDPSVDTTLRGFVSKIIKDNVSGIMGVFVKPDKIYDSIKENLVKSLSQADTQYMLYEKFCLFVDRLPSTDFTEGLLNLTPAQIFDDTENFRKGLEVGVRHLVYTLAQMAGTHIVGHIDIAQITEDKVNEFKAADAERLIISVMNNQLKWIVRLGGLIGLVIGLVMALITHA